MRVLVTGWPSFRHGEATAGDVLSMRAVHAALSDAGIFCDLAWSPNFQPGALDLDHADPADYTDVVFTCGPAHGTQIEWLHRRFARCRRIAAGVSVLDEHAPSVTGFHHVLARDRADLSTVDISVCAPILRTPVVGVVLAPGQREYGTRVRQVHEPILDWIGRTNCAAVPVDTRLDTTDWSHCSTPDQVVSLLERMDMIVTTRLHGMALALRTGTPALAVDPIAGGGKVSAQATALSWPAVIGADALSEELLDRWWTWCLSAEGLSHARKSALVGESPVLAELTELLAREGVR